MTNTKPKYSGKQIFDDVYNRLESMARNGDNPLNYKDIAIMMGLLPQGNNMSKETGRILDEICDYEDRHNRPMLSALVVTVDKKIPGEGFFGKAIQLGKSPGNTKQSKKRFWEQELQAVYNTWG